VGEIIPLRQARTTRDGNTEMAGLILRLARKVAKRERQAQRRELAAAFRRAAPAYAARKAAAARRAEARAAADAAVDVRSQVGAEQEVQRLRDRLAVTTMIPFQQGND
jgi:hypothetical protein